MPSSTSANPPSSTSSSGGVDPQLDDLGFPTNDEYLRENGLTLTDLNRAYVQQQDEYQALQQDFQGVDSFLEQLLSPDPQVVQQALMAFRENAAQMQQKGQQGNPPQSQQGYPQQPPQTQAPPQGYPAFPGGNPNQYGYQDPMNALQQALQMGTPMDNVAGIQQAWANVPEDYIRSLAFQLIREY